MLRPIQSCLKPPSLRRTTTSWQLLSQRFLATLHLHDRFSGGGGCYCVKSQANVELLATALSSGVDRFIPFYPPINLDS